MITFKEFIKESNASELLSEVKFSKDQIEKLKSEYESINKIDPSSPTYKKLTAMLDKMDDETLKQLSDAKIKFVSSLALNRLNRRKLNK